MTSERSFTILLVSERSLFFSVTKNTKKRTLATALEMFSQKGFAGTNIRELTASLGLVKSSLYKHFGSKEEIWDTLLAEMSAYYEARFGSPAHIPPVPDSLEEFVAMTMRMVDFTVHDEKVIMTRKLLMIEQFRDDPAMLAFAYTAPISSLIHLCDREPQRTQEALAQVEAFSRHFIKTYAVKAE